MDGYEIGAGITWVLCFFAIWIGCAMEYGFMGFALAWMPAAIIATILAVLWPLIVFLLVFGGALLFLLAR